MTVYYACYAGSIHSRLAPAAGRAGTLRSPGLLGADVMTMMGNEVDDGLRKVLAIRMRKDERAMVEQKAVAAGLPPATYIREAALHATVAPMKSEIPEINREAWATLARACANLNQYQAAINAGQATGYPPQFLEQLRDQVQKMRRALIGTREGDIGQ